MVRSNTDFKIRELTNFDGLKNTLKSICILLGVKEVPDENIMTQMVNIIKDEFEFFTVQDITDAVKKALSGKLNIDFQPYNNFSIPYICKILTAYREYLNNEGKLTPKLIESPVMDDKKKKESHSKWLDSCVFPYIEKFNKGEITEVPDFGNTLYNYLDKRFINFSKDRKDQIKEKARTELLSELRVEKMGKPGDRNMIGQSITDILMGGQDTEGLVRTRAKKLALNTFITECKEMDRNLINEIKEYEHL